MRRTLKHTDIVLSPYGLLVIYPRTLVDATDYARLFSHLSALTRGQPAHLTSPHCTVLKDHDEGSDLFMIEACTECPVLDAQDVHDEPPH